MFSLLLKCAFNVCIKTTAATDKQTVYNFFVMWGILWILQSVTSNLVYNQTSTSPNIDDDNSCVRLRFYNYVELCDCL